MKHTSVLLHESTAGLNLASGDTAIDATLGLGGHTELIAKIVGSTGVVLTIDADENALSHSQKRLEGQKTTIHYALGNFRDIDTIARRFALTSVNGILFDLGWNATQLDAGRGFSFRSNDPLRMTFSATPKEGETTAETIVNSWSEEDLRDIIETLGEERFARRIAHAIVSERKSHRIQRADTLADIIKEATPRSYQNGRIHPATKTFQALRMLVNDELSTIATALEKSLTLLMHGGRIVVITFHSLEDGLVKRIFKQYEKDGIVRIITKKPIAPSREETLENPRARSAKLRIIEKI